MKNILNHHFFCQSLPNSISINITDLEILSKTINRPKVKPKSQDQPRSFTFNSNRKKAIPFTITAQHQSSLINITQTKFTCSIRMTISTLRYDSKQPFHFKVSQNYRQRCTPRRSHIIKLHKIIDSSRGERTNPTTRRKKHKLKWKPDY